MLQEKTNKWLYDTEKQVKDCEIDWWHAKRIFFCAKIVGLGSACVKNQEKPTELKFK